MLVTTATNGFKRRKLPSLSSASATNHSPLPNCALAPADKSWPPITKVGSKPPSRNTLAVSEVVVVLPCVPAMAIPRLKRMSSANISARGTTGIRCALAARRSALSALMALDITTTSAPAIFSAAWPLKIVAPIACKRLVALLSL